MAWQDKFIIAGEFWQNEAGVLYRGNSLEIIKEFPSDSIDAIITDPPYGMGISKWDGRIEWSAYLEEFKRILKPEGFLAFFGLGFSFFEWVLEAKKVGFDFIEHIIWVKRSAPPQQKGRLIRTFENIAILGEKRRRFYKYTGRWDDVKLEGIRLGLVDIETIKRWFSDLKANGGKRIKRSRVKTGHPEYERLRKDNEVDFERANFTTVWSFRKDNDGRHPTAKPIKLCERLVELLTLPGHIVLDPFMGSGSILIGAYKLRRRFIGIEKERKYYETAVKLLSSTQVYLFEDL